MIKIFTVFAQYSNGDREFFNIYPSMVKTIDQCEQALTEDDEIESMFICYDMILPDGRKTIRTYTMER